MEGKRMDEEVCVFGHELLDGDFYIERTLEGQRVAICSKHEREILNGIRPNTLPRRFCVLEQDIVPPVKCPYCTFKGCNHVRNTM